MLTPGDLKTASQISKLLHDDEVKSMFVKLVSGPHTEIQLVRVSRLLTIGDRLRTQLRSSERFNQKMSERIRKAAAEKHAQDIDVAARLPEELHKLEVRDRDNVFSRDEPKDVEMSRTLVSTGANQDTDIGAMPPSSEASKSTGF